MLVGYNQNVTYKGVTFHVQTEDNGVKNPYIITHVFISGNIIATKKTSYMDIVKIENLEKILRELMEEQQKEMVQKILNGEYDSHPLVKDLLKEETTQAQEEGFDEIDLDSGESIDDVILDYLEEEDSEGKH
jgi:isopentenyl phosphate kinase